MIDRGIYGKEVLQKINRYGYKIITWEKVYRRDGWDESVDSLKFRLTIYRNNYQDLLCYYFKYMRKKSDKIVKISLTNKKCSKIKKTIYRRISEIKNNAKVIYGCHKNDSTQYLSYKF